MKSKKEILEDWTEYLCDVKPLISNTFEYLVFICYLLVWHGTIILQDLITINPFQTLVWVFIFLRIGVSTLRYFIYLRGFFGVCGIIALLSLFGYPLFFINSSMMLVAVFLVMYVIGQHNIPERRKKKSD